MERLLNGLQVDFRVFDAGMISVNQQRQEGYKQEQGYFPYAGIVLGVLALEPGSFFCFARRQARISKISLRIDLHYVLPGAADWFLEERFKDVGRKTLGYMPRHSA